MPFKSKAQARWMFANNPKMAKRWASHTGDIGDLPDKTQENKEMEKKENIDEASPWTGIAKKFGFGKNDDSDDFSSTGNAPIAAKKSTIDPGKLRDPIGFVDNVASFINGVDADVETMKHFASKYSNDKSLDATPKLDMLKLKKDFDDISTAVEPRLSRLGKDMKGVGNRLQQRKEKQGNVYDVDVRSKKQREKDTADYQQMRSFRR